jgi:hypothetical protein
LIDTSRSSKQQLKLQAFNEKQVYQDYEFHVGASNVVRNDATAITVSGPDVDGLLVSMMVGLVLRNCSLVELHAKRIAKEKEGAKKADGAIKAMIEDVFYVVNRETGKPFDDDKVDDLAKGLLDFTRRPMIVNSAKALALTLTLK